MLTCDDRKLLTEFLGEPYFESEGSYYLGGLYADGSLIPMRIFTTWQDTGDLKERIVEMGEWHGFWMYAATEFKEVQHKAGKVVWRKSEMSNWLMDPICFPELVVGWIKERGRG